MINRYGELQNMFRRAGFGVVLLAGLGACGGGSGNAGVPTPPAAEAPGYLIGGMVSGLVPGAQVVLSNGADKLTVTANGAFHFAGKLPAGASYEGKIDSTSEGLGCSIAKAAATVGNTDVNTLTVRCLPVLLAGVQEKIQDVSGIVQDVAGNYYIADAVRQVIHKVTPGGVLSLYAGISGKPGADDGFASSATFNMRSGASLMTIDRDANLYLVENCNALLRKITPAGVVSTVAGQRRPLCDWSSPDPVLADGLGAQAQLGRFESIAMDINGDVLLADAERQFIRRVTPAGLVSSIKVTSVQGEEIEVAQLAVDANGMIYFSERFGGRLFRLQNGKAVLVAGNTNRGGSDGKGTAARFRGIRGMVFDRDGNLLLSDRTAIRRMTPGGEVTTVVGGAVSDAAGVVTDWSILRSLLLDSSGSIIVYDAENHRLNRFSATKVLTSLSILPGNIGPKDGVGGAARLGRMPASGMCSDPAGNVYLLDTANNVLRRITPDGTFSVYAGIIGRAGSDDGPRTSATMRGPVALACGNDGAVYFADQILASNSLNLRKISKDGVVSTQETLPASQVAAYEHLLAIDKDGYMTWTGPNIDIFRRPPGGTFSKFVSFETMMLALGYNDYSWEYIIPNSMVFDSKGNLYFDDYVHQVIFKVDRAGKISIFAGTIYKGSGADGPPGVGNFSFIDNPHLAIDAADNLYLSGQGRLRKIDPAGVISTPSLPWAYPDLNVLTYGNGTLYGFTAHAVLQIPLP